MRETTLIGSSNAMAHLLERVRLCSSIRRPIIVAGERGSGKELIAERLHYLSPRWDKPYITLNCATLAENLLEAELFGYERGAFTGATQRTLGRFERAHEGSLFLDEIATMSPRVQEKCLRVLEYGQLERLGGATPIEVDVRIIAATNESLPELVADGRFRADLLDRLSFDVLAVPPLRQRGNDILELANHFALAMCRELNRDWFPGFSARAEQILLEYSWPGNVRELKNAVERSLARSEVDEQIDQIILNPFTTRPAANSTEVSSAPPTIRYPQSLTRLSQAYERTLLEQALQYHRYRLNQTAEALELSYHQLRRLINKHNLKQDQ